MKAAQLVGEPGSWKLVAAASVPREAGVAPDAAPASAAAPPPKDAAAPALSSAEIARLRDVLDRQGFIGRRVVLAVPQAKLVTSVLELPPAHSAAPRARIARHELAAMHRLDPRTIELSFWDLPATARARDSSRVIAAACSHPDAHALLDAFEAGGLEPVALDIKAAAIARACGADAAEAPHDPSVAAVLDLAHSGALLVLLHRGTIIYERHIAEAGVAALRSAAIAELSAEPDVADFLLREVGLSDPGEGGDPAPGPAEAPLGCAVEALDATLLADLHALLRAHCKRLLDELHTSLAYAAHQYPDAPFEALRVIGGGASTPGLCGHLADAAQLFAAPLSPADGVAFAPAAEPLAHDPSLTVALGLAMHEEAR